MKDALISREDLRKLHPVFRGKYGDKIIDFGVKYLPYMFRMRFTIDQNTLQARLSARMFWIIWKLSGLSKIWKFWITARAALLLLYQIMPTDISMVLQLSRR